jgi:hypothetical protein
LNDSSTSFLSSEDVLLDLSFVVSFSFFSSKDLLDDSSSSFLSSEDLLLVSFSSFLASEALSSASFLSFFSRLSFSLSLSFDDSLEWIHSDSFDFTLRLKAEESALLLLLFGDFEADLDEAA